MPDPVQADSFKGQAPGARAEQEAFEQQTRSAVESFGFVAPPPQQEAFAPQLPPSEKDGAPPVISLDDGDIDLSGVLFGATERPDEDIRTGLPGVLPTAVPVSAKLKRIAQNTGAADAQMLADLADRLGL